jgi:hypothetical protein
MVVIPATSYQNLTSKHFLTQSLSTTRFNFYSHHHPPKCNPLPPPGLNVTQSAHEPRSNSRHGNETQLSSHNLKIPHFFHQKYHIERVAITVATTKIICEIDTIL